MASALSAPDSYFRTLSNPDERRSFPVEGNGIELIELHDEPAGEVFPSLLSVYQQRGYDRGYQRAVADIVNSLFAVTEGFVTSSTGLIEECGIHSPAELRRLLYQFGQQLERRLQTLSPDPGYLSDGLGI
jgi:hypothetical protein